MENIMEAAKRCAMDDLGVTIRGWTRTLSSSYSSRDPRDPRFCENELLHVLVTNYDGRFRMNKKNAYELRWVGLVEISRDSADDLTKEPVDRRYAPWVHAIFALTLERVEEALSVR